MTTPRRSARAIRSARASGASGASRARLATVVVAVVSLGSACSQTPPGVAAEVAGDEITVTRVDDLAALLCSLGGLPGGPEAATRTAREQALNLLVNNELALDLVDEGRVDPNRLREVVAQNAQAREGVPEDLRDTFDEVVRDFSLVQIGLVERGREALLAAGVDPQEVTDEAAFQEAQAEQQAYAAQADVELADRFGTFENGTVTADPGSLSVPVSDLAVQSSSQEASATLGALLPASQKCG